MSAALDFRLPAVLEESAPPEERGLPRDAVRLMVARGGRPLRHTTFRELAAQLEPGDLLVVNESATVPPPSRPSARTATGSSSTSRPRTPR